MFAETDFYLIYNFQILIGFEKMFILLIKFIGNLFCSYFYIIFSIKIFTTEWNSIEYSYTV